jgi:hypothetical protein
MKFSWLRQLWNELPVTRRLTMRYHSGLGHRLEGLPLSLEIAHRFGHKIFLDWPELEAFDVVGAKRGDISPIDRLFGINVHRCDEATLNSLKNYKRIIQHSYYVPTSINENSYLETYRRVKLRPKYIEAISRTFSCYRDIPIVGVHIRRGDFTLVDPDSYDSSSRFHQAVPIWWYEYVMRSIARRFPRTLFLLAYTGTPDEVAPLRNEFSTIELPLRSVYKPQRPSHHAGGHLVTELFALASCNVIIATPKSSFSHLAANGFGEPSTAIIPPPQTSRDSPQFAVAELYGRSFPYWVAASNEGVGVKIVSGNSDIPKPEHPRTNWMSGAAFE